MQPVYIRVWLLSLKDLRSFAATTTTAAVARLARFGNQAKAAAVAALSRRPMIERKKGERKMSSHLYAGRERAHAGSDRELSSHCWLAGFREKWLFSSFGRITPSSESTSSKHSSALKIELATCVFASRSLARVCLPSSDFDTFCQWRQWSYQHTHTHIDAQYVREWDWRDCENPCPWREACSLLTTKSQRDTSLWPICSKCFNLCLWFVKKISKFVTLTV